MNPTLRQFAAFVQIARLGSFARASESLGLSQPALSQSLSQMETLLGARLFSRTTRALKLTREGTMLLPHAEAILGSVDEAVALMREQAGLARARISLGALPSLVPVFLPAILRIFRERQPSTQVAVTDGTSEVLYGGVENGLIDLAISSRLPGHAGIVFEPVLREPFALVLPRSHPLARRSSVTWAEALRCEFLSFPPGSAGHTAMADTLQRAGLALNPSLTFAQSITALNMVAGGAGIAALPILGCPSKRHPTLVTRTLTEPTVEREVGVIHATGREMQPVLHTLHAIAKECLRSRPLALR